MALSSDTRTYLLERIASIDSAITALDAAYLAAIETNEVEEYTFDSAEARQRAKMRDPDKLLDQIEKLRRIHQSLVNRLNRVGITNMNLRRR